MPASLLPGRFFADGFSVSLWVVELGSTTIFYVTPVASLVTTIALSRSPDPMSYRCVTPTLEGFIQQLACSYLTHGYWFYVAGFVPDGKDAAAVDAKLVGKYGVAVSESTRYRRKRVGLANLQYLRFGRSFVLIATLGRHPFKDDESGVLKDIRRVPFKIGGYSVSYRRGGRTRAGTPDPDWHAHVEIYRPEFNRLRAFFQEIALRRSVEALAMEFYRLPFEPYAPVRRQMLQLWKDVNARRKTAVLPLLPIEVLPLRRRVMKPFEPRPGHAVAG